MDKREPILRIENLTKKFGNRVAVNNISFNINPGEIFGFLGPNGAGKTTTMRAICGLCNIDSGNIYVDGYSVSKNFEKAMSKIGALIENPLMYGYMSGYDNLKYYASLYKGISKENILHCARIVGLENRLKDKVKNYSLGMRQRLGIAQALLHNPKLLILDEPLSGLDPSGVKEMREFLKSIAHNNNIAILISSHMLSEMEHLCDTIGIINNGSLVDIKNIDSIASQDNDNKFIKLKVNFPSFAGKVIQNNFKIKCETAGDSVLAHTDESKIAEITKKLIEFNIDIYGVETITKPLEDIFMDVIKKNSNGQFNTSIF